MSLTTTPDPNRGSVREPDCYRPSTALGAALVISMGALPFPKGNLATSSAGLGMAFPCLVGRRYTPRR